MMVKVREPRLRSQYIINPQFQLKWSLLLIFISLLTALLVSFLLLKHTGGIGGRGLALHQLEFRQIVTVLLESLAVLSVAVLFFGIWMTHRISGPLFAMRRHMERIIAGYLDEPLAVRRRDEFRELVEVYNQMVSYLREKSEHHLRHLNEISHAIDRNPKRAQQLLGELAAAHRVLIRK